MSKDWGSKIGSGGVASATQSNVERRERLRQLAIETFDAANDPYFMRNHLGSYECKLCLTLHTTEGSYMVHTQGKKHQTNLAKRAAKLQKEQVALPLAPKPEDEKDKARKKPRIGRPAYKLLKQKDGVTGALSLLFQIYYPYIEEGLQPRHRFMSAFEQKVEKPDDKFQFILFAAEPYETIAFKIPNKEIDRSLDRFFTHWDDDTNTFTLQLFFKLDKELQEKKKILSQLGTALIEDDDEENDML